MSTVTNLARDYKIVDCDAHFTEPPDLWTSRVPRSMQDRVPVMKTEDNFSSWFYEGEVWASIGGNTIRQGMNKVLGDFMIQPFAEIDPSAWSVSGRLALMDTMGIHSQILYPNGIGFSSNHIFAIENPEDRALILRTYNDFYVDLQAESGGRLLPQALLPIWDMKMTVSEMERLAAAGVRGFTLSDRPELLGLPELHESYFDPMWRTFEQSGTVANFHIGAGRRREEMEGVRAALVETTEETASKPREVPAVASPSWHGLGRQRSLAVFAVQAHMSNVRIIANLCMSNLFDRFPRLRIVSAESGVGWVPFLLQALEYEYDEMVRSPEELDFAKQRPSDYFRDHLYVTFWFEQVSERLLEAVGVDNVLIETDVPHPTCLYPGTEASLARSLNGVQEEMRRKVLQDNAAKLYSIDI